MSHIYQKGRSYFIGDMGKPLKVNNPGIGTGTGNEKLGPVLPGNGAHPAGLLALGVGGFLGNLGP